MTIESNWICTIRAAKQTAGLITALWLVFCLISEASAPYPCEPFKFHPQARIPIERQFALVGRGTFPQCVGHYTRQDLDHDGISDWTSIVDGNPSKMLIPFDPDIDGDGTLNLWDPAPFDHKLAGTNNPLVLPSHLVETDSDIIGFQAEIYRDYGIVALSNTDHQSPDVLQNFLYLAGTAFSKATIRKLDTFKVLYSFKSHDHEFDIAAFHWKAQAISIGGRSTYGKIEMAAADRRDPNLLSALAHEIGHAFLVQHLKPRELRNAAIRFGALDHAEIKSTDDSFYSPSFFRPLHDNLARNFATPYAASNVHEWFAEAFAALAMRRLGLGDPTARLTPDFIRWMDSLMSGG